MYLTCPIVDSKSVSVEITHVQATAAKNAGLIYFWRICTDTGKIVDQFDPITGTEQAFSNWVELVDKKPTDPYYGSFAFKKIDHAFWVPVIDKTQAFYLEKGDADSFVIYRKNYTRMDSSGKYVVYCIGQRYDTDVCEERVYHICPPARYHIHMDRSEPAIFHGGVSLLTVPGQQNLFDAFAATL